MCFGENCGRTLELLTRKLLSVENSVSFSVGAWKIRIVSNADDGDLAFSFRGKQRLYMAVFEESLVSGQLGLKSQW